MNDFQEEVPTLTEMPETLAEVLVRWRAESESDRTRLPRPHVYFNVSTQEIP